MVVTMLLCCVLKKTYDHAHSSTFAPTIMLVKLQIYSFVIMIMKNELNYNHVHEFWQTLWNSKILCNHDHENNSFCNHDYRYL